MKLIPIKNDYLINPAQVVSIEPIGINGTAYYFTIILSNARYPQLYSTREEAQAEYNILLDKLRYEYE